WVLWAITRAYPDKLNLVLEEEKSHPSQPEQSHGIFGNRYVTLILLLVVLITVTHFFLDNIFYGLAQLRFKEKEELASFIGLFTALVGLVTLLCQVGLSSHLLTRFGVRAGILVLPVVIGAVLLLLAMTNFTVGPVILAFGLAATAKLLDYSLRDSVNRSSLQTLYQPFSAARRAHTIATMDGVVEPLAAGLAGLTLLMLDNYFGLAPTQLALPALVVVIGWLWVASDVGKRYPAMLVAALRTRRLGQADLSLSEPSSLAAVTQAIHDPNPAVALYALNLLQTADRAAMTQLGPALFAHPASEVRLAGIAQIEASATNTPQMHVLLAGLVEGDADLDVRGAALRALAVLYPEDAEELAPKYLHSGAWSMRRGAFDRDALEWP
ncbi:MAG: hypothetical protein HC802_20410, partial [Caldilineaceae bacterium]|nr:hypothetical protein [Caldilineaceae bacterium]